MNVLSLFDGMSCGQIALKELGIEPDIYYASEIDKFAIKQRSCPKGCNERSLGRQSLSFRKALAGLQRHLERNKSNGNGFGADCRTENQKSQTLCLSGTGKYDLVYQKDRIRRLTPVERARLQTIPEWYKWECSATQQCRMLGNGWTVDVIVHILSHMKLNEIE